MDRPYRAWEKYLDDLEDCKGLKTYVDICPHIQLSISLEDDDWYEYVQHFTIKCKICNKEYTNVLKVN